MLVFRSRLTIYSGKINAELTAMIPKIRFAVAVSALPVPRSFVGNIFMLLVSANSKVNTELGLGLGYLRCVSIQHGIHYV